MLYLSLVTPTTLRHLTNFFVIVSTIIIIIIITIIIVIIIVVIIEKTEFWYILLPGFW